MELTVICIIEKLDVYGVVTSYNTKQWIADENHPEGGSHQTVLKQYPSPRINIGFVGKVNISLISGAIYTDGTNNFQAISKDTITNHEDHLVSFTIPKKLMLISKPFNESKS